MQKLPEYIETEQQYKIISQKYEKIKQLKGKIGDKSIDETNIEQATIAIELYDEMMEIIELMNTLDDQQKEIIKSIEKEVIQTAN